MSKYPTDPEGVDYEISGGRADCDQVQRNVARDGLNGWPDANTVQFRWIEATVPPGSRRPKLAPHDLIAVRSALARIRHNC